MNRKRKGNVGFILTMIVLSLVFFISMTIFILCLRPNRYTFTNEYSDMQRAFDKGDYEELSKMVYSNKSQGLKTKEDSSEFETFVNYYQSATLYYAYLKTGEEDQARKELEIMTVEEDKLQKAEFQEAAREYVQSLQGK